MNLVALLIAPLVVEHANDDGLAYGIAFVAAAILAVAIWISKSRRSELDAELKAADQMATTSA
jgi:hypothetical protein